VRRLSCLIAATNAEIKPSNRRTQRDDSDEQHKNWSIAVYIYQHAEWPKFHWNIETIAVRTAAVRHRMGKLAGRLEALGLPVREDALVGVFTTDVVKTSEIEGDTLDQDQVRSSVARHLGLDYGGVRARDRLIDGVVAMVLDATQRCAEPLTRERLFSWHAELFPTGDRDTKQISVGAWREDRTGPMEVISGAIGRIRVHFRALPAADIPAEMERFLAWFETSNAFDPVIKAALSHLWFVTLHPFDDGNGRIARAIADMALARAESASQRFYSMSSQIRTERNDYYNILERTQKGNLDVTPWLCWFLDCLERAITSSETALGDVLRKSLFWKQHGLKDINSRHKAVLSRLLDGFIGHLTSSKYAKLAKCSQDTAARDLNQLVALGVMTKGSARGRSTAYELVLAD